MMVISHFEDESSEGQDGAQPFSFSVAAGRAVPDRLEHEI
jgi:hypothetical protein